MLNVLECKHCHAPLPKDDLAMNNDVIVCEFCSTVHYMNPQDVSYPEKSKRREKNKRSKPDKFTLNRMPDGLEITYRWLGKQHKGLLFFAILWNAFIVFFTAIMFFAGFDDSDIDSPVAVLCFMIPFYAVGIGMAWYVLAGYLNRTNIRIRGNGIETNHAPIPMFGAANKRIDRKHIAQIYCIRRVAYTSNDVPVYVYDVHYVKDGGDDYDLVKGVDSLNKAIFIEQQIEHLYRIEDAGVDDEYQSQF